MGFFDSLFGGGTPAEKAQRLKAKATQKYGDPLTRQKAIDDLGKLKSPESIAALMYRFTVMVEPQSTDTDEKDVVFNLICDQHEQAVGPVVDFLKKSDAASSWAVKILDTILEDSEVIGIVTSELQRLGAEYTRDPEKKEVLLHFLEGKQDERIGPAALPLLHDMSDDVKLCALKTLASVKFEPAREPILQLLVADETAKRVQSACVQALVDTGFDVKGFTEKVQAKVLEPYFVDRSGVVKKRG